VRIDEAGNTIEDAIELPLAPPTYEHYVGWPLQKVVDREFRTLIVRDLSDAQTNLESLRKIPLPELPEALQGLKDELQAAEKRLARLEGELFTFRAENSPVFERVDAFLGERAIWINFVQIAEKMERGTLEIFIRGRLDYLRGRFYTGEIVTGLYGMEFLVRRELLQVLAQLVGEEETKRLAEEISQKVRERYHAPQVAKEPYRNESGGEVRMENQLIQEKIARAIALLRMNNPSPRAEEPKARKVEKRLIE